MRNNFNDCVPPVMSQISQVVSEIQFVVFQVKSQNLSLIRTVHIRAMLLKLNRFLGFISP